MRSNDGLNTAVVTGMQGGGMHHRFCARERPRQKFVVVDFAPVGGCRGYSSIDTDNLMLLTKPEMDGPADAAAGSGNGDPHVTIV